MQANVRWLLSVLVAAGCASRATVLPTVAATMAAPAVGDRAQTTASCVEFPSRSLPDPPEGFASPVCWRDPPLAGRTLGPCPASMERVAQGTLSIFAPEFSRRTASVDAFCIERTEVTVEAYGACARAGACAGDNQSVDAVRMRDDQRAMYSAFCNARFGPARANHPMNCVSWPQATAYCQWRYGARSALPTDEQWAYAARGPTQNVYPWGDSLPTLFHANRCGLSCARALGRVTSGVTLDGEADTFVSTAPVGSFARGASPFAVHDLAGNVAEWTRTVYGQYRYTASQSMQYQSDDPALRVVRGGSWMHVDETPLTIDERGWLLMTDRAAWVGFRCVLEGR